MIRHLIILSLAFLLSAPGSVSAQDVETTAERIVAIGDVHGDYDQFFTLLREVGLVSRRGKWTGGKTHLVQLGDIADRGPDTLKVIELLRKLEQSAAKAGGAVHVLLGNHEVLNIVGDTSYVHPGEFAAFKSRQAKRLQDAYYQATVRYFQSQPGNEEKVYDEAFRTEWEKTHPLGFVEHRQAWATNGKVGAWVLNRPTILRINRLLFIHGGLGASYIGRPIAQINAEISGELALGEHTLAEGSILSDPEGPLWHRTFARDESDVVATQLAALKQAYDVDRLIIAHTPIQVGIVVGTILPRHGGDVIVTDTGMSAHYRGGRAALIIEGERYSVMHAGKLFDLPMAADQLPSYLAAIAEHDGETRGLQRYRKKLLAPPEPKAALPAPANN